MCYNLHVRLVGAKDIPKMDLFGKSDPYCIISTLSTGMNFKSSVKKNTKTPVWNEDFHFPVQNPQSEYLNIDMYDKDVSKDDKMSTFRLALSTLPFGIVVDMWYDLLPVSGVKKAGQIHLVLHLASPQDPPFVMSANNPNQAVYHQPPMMQPPPMMYQQPPMMPPQMMYPQQPQQMMPPPMMYPQQPQPMMMQPPMQPPMMMGQPGMPMMGQPMMMGQPGMQMMRSPAEEEARKIAMNRAMGGY